MYNIVNNSVLAEFRRSAGNPDALIGAFEAPTITEVPQTLAAVNDMMMLHVNLRLLDAQVKFNKDHFIYE